MLDALVAAYRGYARVALTVQRSGFLRRPWWPMSDSAASDSSRHFSFRARLSSLETRIRRLKIRNRSWLMTLHLTLSGLFLRIGMRAFAKNRPALIDGKTEAAYV